MSSSEMPVGMLERRRTRKAQAAKAQPAKGPASGGTSWTAFFIMIAIAVLALTPFIWAGLTAIKPFADAFQNPPVWSFTPQFASFIQLWQATNFAQVLGNTAIVAVASTVVSLLVGAPAAYAFARYRGRIGPILLVLALVFRALPRFAVVLPFYQASRAIGIYDTKVALVIAFVAVNMPFLLLLLTGFFRELPLELDESAMIDGCTRLQAFRRVIVPLSGPGLVAAGLFAFLLAFQEYLVALTLTQHGMFGLDRVITLLQAVSGGPAMPMVRCSHLDLAEIGKLLDGGAYGLICPSIDTAEQCVELVSACRYPPVGRRSFGPSRGLLYGGPDYVQHARPVGAAPDSSSRSPFATVSGDTPAAAATSFTPPRPTSRASAPSTSRRCRSSRYGHSDAHLRATPSSTTDIPRA